MARFSPLESTANSNTALLVVGARQLLTLRGSRGPRRGQELAQLGIVNDGAVLMRGGRVVAAGTAGEVKKHPAARGARVEVLDAGGRVVMPAFVDSHTHLAFA